MGNIWGSSRRRVLPPARKALGVSGQSLEKFLEIPFQNLRLRGKLYSAEGEGREWGVGSGVIGYGVFGAPRFSVQRLQNIYLKGCGTSGQKIGGPQQTPNPTTTDPTPHSRPSELTCSHSRWGVTKVGQCSEYCVACVSDVGLPSRHATGSHLKPLTSLPVNLIIHNNYFY